MLYLVIYGIANQLRARLIIYHLLLFGPVDMIQAKLMLLELGEVIFVALGIVPLFLLFFLVPAGGSPLAFAADPAHPRVDRVVRIALVLRRGLQVHL